MALISDSADYVLQREAAIFGGGIRPSRSAPQDAIVQPTALGISQPEPPELDWRQTLINELERFPVGRVMFNPPDTMKLGIHERVEVRISQDNQVDIISNLIGHGITQIEEMKVSESMKVKLIGNSFKINRINEHEEQIVVPSGFTEWAWDVTPNKIGKQKLFLRITLGIRLPYGEVNKDLTTLERELLVNVNPIYSAKLFAINYWKWIITSLLIPLLGWLFNAYTKGS